MAKKQSSAGLFERAGYALGASKLKMQHHDYIKSLKENINISQQKGAQLKKENPNGIVIDKVGKSDGYDIENACLNIAEERKRLSSINEGDIDPKTGQPYDMREVRAAIDMTNNQMSTLNANTENKAAFTKSTMDRGAPSQSASIEEIANYEAVNSKNYGKDGLDQRLNYETLEWEWYDQTVGKHVPIAQFNAGSAYDSTLEDMTYNNDQKIIEVAANNPDEWKYNQESMMQQMKKYLKDNPNAAKNLIFENDDFELIKDNYLYDYYSDDIEQNPNLDIDFETWKNSSQGDAAIELLKKQNVDNEFFLNEYEMMIDKRFAELAPEEEEEGEVTLNLMDE